MSEKENIFKKQTLLKRHKKEKFFKNLTFISLLFSILFLFIFLYSLFSYGITAFRQTYILVDITYDKSLKYITTDSIDQKYKKFVSRASLREITVHLKNNPSLLNKTVPTWVLANAQVDQYIKGNQNRLNTEDKKVVDTLQEKDRIETKFNTLFFSNGDSTMAEFSGIFSSLIGSLITLLVTILFAIPIGVMSAIYLEEYAKNNRFTQIIEININNLAALPPIIFGLLGLAIFVNYFALPKGSALVGGLTLAVMTLPIIIVSSRSALRAIPSSIKEAGYALGLTKTQILKAHVLPLALPSILTGSILGLSRSLGETAPLLIIGMVAFAPDTSSSIMDATSVLPAQIYNWSSMSDYAFIEKTAAATIVLLSTILLLNFIVMYLRKRYKVKL